MGMPVNETVKIVNEYSQLVLEVEGEATTEGTRIEQYTDTGRDHQRWRLKPAAAGNEGFYNIENVHSAMSIEVVGYSKEPGAEIVQRPYGPGPLHRQWKLVPVTGKKDVYNCEPEQRPRPRRRRWAEGRSGTGQTIRAVERRRTPAMEADPRNSVTVPRRHVIGR